MEPNRPNRQEDLKNFVAFLNRQMPGPTFRLLVNTALDSGLLRPGLTTHELEIAKTAYERTDSITIEGSEVEISEEFLLFLEQVYILLQDHNIDPQSLKSQITTVDRMVQISQSPRHIQ